MLRFFSTVIVLALIVGCVSPPTTVLASPIVAQGVNAPADPTPPSTPTPLGPRAAPPGAIALTFEDADIETVTRAVSEIVGFSYIMAPDVHGKVTIRTAGAIRREDVFSVFLSILEVHGFTAVKAGDVYKIVRTETARERAIPTFIDPLPRPTPPPREGSPPGATLPPGPSTGNMPPGAALPPDHFVTQVLVPRFAVATMLASVLRPLVSSRGSIIEHPLANALIVTDTAANVGRITGVVTRLDVESAAEEVHVIRLQYADASYVASLLNHVFLDARLPRPPMITADRRTNSLVIRARPSELEAIGRLLGHD